MEKLFRNAIVAALLIVLLIIVVSSSILIDAQPQVPICVTDEDRVNIRRLMLTAIDDALHDHTKALFTGWLKDPTGQPKRASTGMQAAIVAYQRSRADALKWNPVSCGG
jgi:hypothetical protein